METSFYSYKLQSRPEQLLIDHLSTTASYCSKIVKQTSFYFNSVLNSKQLAKIAELIGYTHDLGKATKYFQNYINEKDENRKKSLKNDKRTHHGLLSSIFTYRIISDYVENHIFNSDKCTTCLPIISFLIVKKHHGNPINLKDEIISINPKNDLEKLNILKEQLAGIDYIDELNNILKQESDIKITIESILEQIDSLVSEDICRQDNRKRRKLIKNDPDFYFLFQFLYSALLTADKYDAAELKLPQNDINLPSNLVDQYLAKKFTNNKSKNFINPIRNAIYAKVCDSLDSINLNEKILSINVPTGTGKTLTGFSFSLKLRERVKAEYGITPKIIYCLPFLSVIDQNYHVFEDLFIKVLNRKPSSSEILKHHHLAEISYQDNINEQEFSSEKSRLLVEGWESEIVVTTFMQFFHTLISNKNRMLRKFCSMTNSIVILDEVQTIPCKYWNLIRKTCIRFSEIFNTWFILMTATKPLIFKTSETKELLPIEDKNIYLSKLDRITFLNRSTDEMDLTDFIRFLKFEIKSYQKTIF